MVKLLSVLVFGLILAGCADEDTGPEEPAGEVTGALRCVQTPTGTFCHAAEPWPVAGPALTCSPHCADPWPTPPAAQSEARR